MDLKLDYEFGVVKADYNPQMVMQTAGFDQDMVSIVIELACFPMMFLIVEIYCF